MNIMFILMAVVAFSPVYSVNQFRSYRRTGFKHERIRNVEPNNGLLTAAVVKQVFEMLRTAIIKGDPQRNITVLDPMKIKTYCIDHRGKLLNLKADIHGVSISGLGGFEVVRYFLNKTSLSMDLEIKFPSIKYKAEKYHMQGLLLEFIHLRGDGKIDIEIKDLNFTGKLNFKQSDNGLAVIIKSLEYPKYEVAKVTSLTEFDNNMDDIFNALIGDLSAYYLTRFSGLISKLYSEDIVNFLNPFLNKFETWRIISTIL